MSLVINSKNSGNYILYAPIFSYLLFKQCVSNLNYLCVPVTSGPLLLSGGSRCKPSCLLIRIQSTAK